MNEWEMVDLVDLVTHYHGTIGPNGQVTWRTDVLPHKPTGTELDVVVVELRRRGVSAEVYDSAGHSFLVVRTAATT